MAEKQITYPTGLSWGVGEGELVNPRTGQTETSRLIVFTEDDGTNHVFPMSEEANKELGECCLADDPHEKMAEINKRKEKLKIATEMPSEDEIQKAKRIMHGPEGG